MLRTTTRPAVYDTYWKFAYERQEIFFKKFAKATKPWTIDPILGKYKFCNAYRACDRVSQYLIRNVIYSSSYSDEDTVFRIILFKLFNKIDTWEYLLKLTGDIILSTFSIDKFGQILNERLLEGTAIYSNAYISCATKAFGYDKKHMNHLALVNKMFNEDRIVEKLLKSTSLGGVFEVLREYPLVGDFLAYQLATDINYSEVINFDEDDFTVVGPGSIRGITKCFQNPQRKDMKEIIHYMVDRQEYEFDRLGLDFKTLWGRRLHCIDCQNLFCELDKYSRVAFPELKSNRSRIKTQYSETADDISYYFPPKWGINQQITNSRNK